MDWTQLHVPGMTCMTPRALAGEIIALLKPLSCHAMAAASDDGAPDCAASVPTCPAVRRPGEAMGAACGTIVRAGAGVVVLIAAPVGSLMMVPATSWEVGFSPFMYAIWAAGTRAAAARPLSVSPGRTL